MKYSEEGFRAFYHSFVAVPVTKNTRNTLKDFPNEDISNYIVCYGYYDSQAGMTLEVLGGALIENGDVKYAYGNNEISSKIRIDLIEDEDCYYLPDKAGDLAEIHKEKLEMLKGYAVSEEVEKTRELAFLDDSRDKVYIDDVLVYLVRDGLKPEGCWTRITGTGDHWFMGTLLNEPDQDFGWHEGESISFFVKETDDHKVICFTDMNPSQKITEEDLEDGSMLKAAVEKFEAERNEPNFIDVLEILRDSYVWIPCTAVFADVDLAKLDKMAKEAGDDIDSLVGMEFSTDEPTRMIPDILKNGDNFFFPIFSSAEEMGEYGENFSKVQRHILDVIPLAVNNEKNVSGIVLNAFSTPFILERQIFDIVQNMKSRVELSKAKENEV